MANKHIQRYSMPLVVREMQIFKMTYHFTNTRIATHF